MKADGERSQRGDQPGERTESSKVNTGASQQTSKQLLAVMARLWDQTGSRAFWGMVYVALKTALLAQGQKRISAMVRLKNEEEFLYPAIKSIVGHVDELVLVDNLSTDDTPSIIQSLQREYPDKVACYQYKHEIRKRGREHWELASTAEGRASPHLSSSYYNWCLERCSEPYILKWDGDMLATAEFSRALQRWRHSSAAVMSLIGANIHPDRRHLIAARSSEAAEIAKALTIPVAPKWVSTMSYTFPEWRLFPRLGARFGSRVWWTQTLSTPFLLPRIKRRFFLRTDEPCFLHLRFCKRDPLTGYSADFRDMIGSNLRRGPPLRPEWEEVLQRWGI